MAQVELKEKWLHPNRLTLYRILAVPGIVVLLLWPGRFTTFIAALLFSAAAITDYLDGWYARAERVERDQRLLDPGVAIGPPLDLRRCTLPIELVDIAAGPMRLTNLVDLGFGRLLEQRHRLISRTSDEVIDHERQITPLFIAQILGELGQLIDMTGRARTRRQRGPSNCGISLHTRSRPPVA